jgi:Domain of Unknown Function (DUF1259)
MQFAPVGPLGVATAINFQPTAGGKAAHYGRPFPRWRGANPVIAALRANGIEVTAVHSHMRTEQPPGVIDMLNAEQPIDVSRIPPVSGARTSLFLPELDRLILAVRAASSEPAAIWIFRPIP